MAARGRIYRRGIIYYIAYRWDGDPRVPLRGHRRTGQRAHTERRHLLVPRGRTGAD